MSRANRLWDVNTWPNSHPSQNSTTAGYIEKSIIYTMLSHCHSHTSVLKLDTSEWQCSQLMPKSSATRVKMSHVTYLLLASSHTRSLSRPSPSLRCYPRWTFWWPYLQWAHSWIRLITLSLLPENFQAAPRPPPSLPQQLALQCCHNVNIIKPRTNRLLKPTYPSLDIMLIYSDFEPHTL